MPKKKDNLKETKATDLEKKLVSLREEERSIRFKSEGARPKNVKHLRNLKREVAQILTELNVRAQTAK